MSSDKYVVGLEIVRAISAVVVLVALFILTFTIGCTTTETVPGPIIYVTDWERPTKFPVEEKPGSELEKADETDWKAILTAMGQDLLACYGWGSKNQSTIEKYNDTVDSMVDPNEVPEALRPVVPDPQ